MGFTEEGVFPWRKERECHICVSSSSGGFDSVLRHDSDGPQAYKIDPGQEMRSMNKIHDEFGEQTRNVIK